ncbi:MAG: hypothetical protein M3261_04680 [Thermoproteota archaeon]|nr:hypothetical protein [Thermoproteota archaeon]
MTTLISPKAILAVVLCYSAVVAFSSFSIEAVYGHSIGGAGSSNNHQHTRVVSVNDLLLQVTPFTAGLAIGLTLLLRKRK